MRQPVARFFIRVGALAAKEATHIRRDPRVLYLALGMPVVMLLLFGYGVSFDIDRIPLAVVDRDQTEASRRLVADFVASGDFVQGASLASEAEIEPLLRRGGAAGALVIPKGLSRDLARGEDVPVQVVFDGSDGMSTTQALARADAIAQAATMRIRREGGLSAAPPLRVSAWTRFNPTGRSAIYLVPGLMAYVLAMVSVLLTALTVAREWERGSMEQLFATPVGRLEIVIGKLLPYLGLGCLQVLLVLAMGAWVFDVPMRGSLALLGVAAVLFMLGMLGQGLLVSVVTRNQMVATQGAMMSSMLPSMLLSGFLFPIENMPLPLRAVSAAIPARYFVHALRGILLKGNGFAEVWPDLAALAGFAALVVVVSTARFQRRLA